MGLMKTYNRFNLTIKYGKGISLFDENGKEYLDFVAGIATNALGYSNSNFKNALKNQIDQVLHVSNLYYTDINNKAASLLCSMSNFDEVFFVNSGTESVEAALKLARIYSKNKYDETKFEVISLKNSFHGRTLGALTLTGQVKYQSDFTPLLPGVRYAQLNNINSLKEVITNNTCAVILEIIQGEGGIVSVTKEYIKDVEQFCKENGLLLIIDEVQTGVGRTGTFYAYEHFDIKPDIICSAKGLGSGFPVGAILTSKEIASSFTFGKHGTTFGGNPLASTAVYTVLIEIKNNNLLSHVKVVGSYLQEQLLLLKQQFKCVKEVRGIGLLQGVEFEDVDTSMIVNSCIEEGLLLVGAGKNVIRFVPPLVVTEEDINQAISILKKILSEVSS